MFLRQNESDCPFCGKRGAFLWSNVIHGQEGSRETWACSSCGHVRKEPRITKRRKGKRVEVR